MWGQTRSKAPTIKDYLQSAQVGNETSKAKNAWKETGAKETRHLFHVYFNISRKSAQPTAPDFQFNQR